MGEQGAPGCHPDRSGLLHVEHARCESSGTSAQTGIGRLLLQLDGPLQKHQMGRAVSPRQATEAYASS